MNGDLWNRL